MSSTLSLNGQWTLSTQDIPFTSIPAQLPGDNYSALLAAGVIPDPYYAKNELAVRKYADYNWTFSRDVNVPKSLLASQFVYLEYSMADTFCKLSINGHDVLETQNSFCAFRPEVKRFLKAGQNHFEFAFKPCVAESERIAKTIPMDIPANPNSVIKHNNYIRKTTCHGGWDWGITLIVSGIYDDILLRGVNKARLDYIYTTQKHTGKTVELTVFAEIYADATIRESVTFAFNGEKKTMKAELSHGINTVVCNFSVKNPKLWWPHGYGEQPLYDLTVATGDAQKSARIGLRKLEIVNERDDIGKSFIVRINDTNIFCKGADWIPCDALVSRQTPERYENLLNSAVSANMNMVRVWGGGQYEKDLFYEMCDEKGILVWQDLMFCCCLYPSEDWYYQLIHEEVTHNIKRLRHHACIALWCGDNECLGATRWYGQNRILELNLLFDRLNRFLTPLVTSLDPERIFWPTSPCAGPGDLSDGWANDTAGDMHYWQVWHGSKNFSAYYSVKPRFCSEFGYEAFPSQELVDSFCPKEEQNILSPIMDHRQKCSMGNTPILTMFAQYFRMPETFGSFLYLSQLQQALAIKTGVEYWRTLKPRCMGTLFWQLNDNWPTVSWSAIEYGGKWKQLQYHARRFYAPVFSTIIRENPEQEPKLYTVSDVPQKLKATVKIQAVSVCGKILKEKTYRTTLNGDSHLFANCKEADIRPQGVADNDFFYNILTEAKADDGAVYTHHNTFFTVTFKELHMLPATVKANVRKDGEVYKIELSANAPAFFVSLDAVGIPGLFSDSSFTLLPGSPVTVTFTPCGQTTATALKKALLIASLRDTYR